MATLLSTSPLYRKVEKQITHFGRLSEAALNAQLEAEYRWLYFVKEQRLYKVHYPELGYSLKGIDDLIARIEDEIEMLKAEQERRQIP